MTGPIPISWALGRMLNISTRSWAVGPPVLAVAPFVKIGMHLEVKFVSWCSKDAPILKFKIMGYKNERRVGVVSIGLLEFEISFFILPNSILLVSPSLVIPCSILVNIDMT
ncbi:unnamed protein product [Lactuca saligna]|uniref:Uncharacterized protein n=1 Tax=Lactuca saligna TaxID=75948 RepID=A0AA35ZSX4_LACSI|nr:unnamed protein product [Lactuca saligna]